MGLKKVKAGSNMYQEWVTHTWSCLDGECSHGCRYCYVQSIEKRVKSGKYCGDIRLNEDEFNTNFGSGKSIFICHMNDLFAENVPHDWITRVLSHCRKYPNNEYIFQSKNPSRFQDYLDLMPTTFILGTTVESDFDYGTEIYKNEETMPPPPHKRLSDLTTLPRNIKLFITVEPILNLASPYIFARWIADCKPDFVNIGADSKKSDLPEPSKEQILEFVAELQKRNVTIRKKINLSRILEV